MANPKVIAVRVPKISIEAVRNGYRVTVPWNDKGEVTVTMTSIADSYFSRVMACGSGSAGEAASKKKGPPPKRITPSGEYVFPDFASLTAWLRKNITHGNGVEA